jgi:hypothetical protein
MSHENYSPENAIEHAADAAMEAARTSLEAEGGEAVKVFVCIQAEGLPAGELDCTVAGHGYDDGPDLLAELLGYARGIAKRMNLPFDIAPFPGGE